MNIKMIVTDLDGTLLRNDKTISERTIEALIRCKEAEIKVVYATARGYAERVAPDNLFDGRILKSGALAYLGSDLVYYKSMQINDVRPFLLRINEAGLKAAVQTTDGFHHANFHVSDVWSYLTNYKIIDFAAIDFDVDKIYVVTGTPQAVNFVKTHAPPGFNLFVSRDDLTFLFHKDAVKSKGLIGVGGGL